jgi:hypothetical protein
MTQKNLFYFNMRFEILAMNIDDFSYFLHGVKPLARIYESPI